MTASPGIPAGVSLRPTLVEPDGLTIPAAWAAPSVTDALTTAAEGGGTAHLVTTALVERAPTRSVIADLPGRRDGPVVMVGAHLDSVLDGPGINDDGSGVATLLEVARALGGRHPEATVRLAFWSGEEMGLHGSSRYAAALSREERESLLVYVNVDMVGSPNGFAGVYEEPDAPEGSSTSAELLRAAVQRAGATPVGVDLHGRSDHYGFADVGVPTAGLFSGALEPVTEDQAAASGATAGRPADPCYHQACDGVENVDLRLARVLAMVPGRLHGPGGRGTRSARVGTLRRGGLVRAVVYDRYGSPGVLRLEDVPCPCRAPVRCSCAWRRRRSTSPTGSASSARPSTPASEACGTPARRVLGSDIAGRVEAVGPGVSRLRNGDEVYGDNLGLKGGFAELCVAPAAVLALKPRGLGFVEASTIPQAGAIALQGTAGAGPGRRVLVNGGGGGSGAFAIQLAGSPAPTSPGSTTPAS